MFLYSGVCRCATITFLMIAAYRLCVNNLKRKFIFLILLDLLLNSFSMSVYAYLLSLINASVMDFKNFWNIRLEYILEIISIPLLIFHWITIWVDVIYDSIRTPARLCPFYRHNKVVCWTRMVWCIIKFPYIKFLFRWNFFDPLPGFYDIMLNKVKILC